MPISSSHFKFSRYNAALFHSRIAIELNLPCTTISLDYEHYQFVLMRHVIPPHELLVKIIVEKHPTYCDMYTVEPPDDEIETYNKILELCSR